MGGSKECQAANEGLSRGPPAGRHEGKRTATGASEGPPTAGSGATHGAIWNKGGPHMDVVSALAAGSPEQF
eukprot:9721513-Alexandrium_andersonii.AAC.1